MLFGLHIPEWMAKLFDWGSLSVTLATLFAYLPHIAAFLAVVWWGFRIYGQYLENKKLKKELENANK